MGKSTRSSSKSEKWTDGSQFLFKSSPKCKVLKTDRRLTMTPKKNLKYAMKNRRQSIMLKRLQIDNNGIVSPRRTRRQSMVNLHKSGKKVISRATSEKIVYQNEIAIKSLQLNLSPLEEKLIKVKTKGFSIKKSRRPNNYKLMSKINLITQEENTKRSAKKQSTSEKLIENITKTNHITENKRKGYISRSKTTSPKQSTSKKIKGISKAKKQPRTKVSERKIIATPKINAIEVQLAVAKAISGKVKRLGGGTPQLAKRAVSGNAKSCLKRLGGRTPQSANRALSGSAKRSNERSPQLTTRALRSAKKVKIILESPPKAEKLCKTPALKDSPNRSIRRRNVKPFTPKPDDPYAILKNNIRRRITNKIEMMDLSPERATSFMSLASTPSSSCDLPPTPKSSRHSFSQEYFIRNEGQSLRNYRNIEETPISSTPKKRSPGNNSTYLSMDESVDGSELSCADSSNATNSVVIEEKKGYCSIM